MTQKGRTFLQNEESAAKKNGFILSASNPLTTEKSELILKRNVEFHCKQRVQNANGRGSLGETDGEIPQECRMQSHPSSGSCVVLETLSIKGTSSRTHLMCKDFPPGACIGSDDDNNTACEEKTCSIPHIETMHSGDDVLEASMVDFTPCSDISPDYFVQRNFLMIRSAIIDQQRVFALQVFELHRLIAVQRLIARLPRILLKDVSYVTTPLDDSPEKKLPLECIEKIPSNFAGHIDKFDSSNQKMDGSAENYRRIVEKTSPSTLPNATWPSNHGVFSGFSVPMTISKDPKLINPCFHQPHEHHWLIPVMFSCEGLVYKPCFGAGFMDSLPVAGGPQRSTTTMTTSLGSAHRESASPCHYQEMQLPSFIVSIGQSGYLPTCGIPVMINPAISGSSAEQMHHFTGTCPGGCISTTTTKGNNFGIHLQSSCNLQSQKNIEVPNNLKSRDFYASTLQINTASTISERPQGKQMGSQNPGSWNALPLFPTSAADTGPDEALQHPVAVQETQEIIKVVPYNARSASAARIFQTLQAERKK